MNNPIKDDITCYGVHDFLDNLIEVSKDPILLKRITSNLFIICGMWKLTKLEEAVI